uniref:Uncharacterized protein n=1 Tax=Ciona savignyi TaxID=51511 RepID=H2ZDW3_CIOSA
MAQVLNSSKKLKQAQLNFTPKNTKPKLRIKLKEQGLDDESADDTALSLSNSTKCVVSLKSSDAEENIQCPEVSTSTLYSDAEAENDVKKDPVVIDLLDDDSCDVHNNSTVVAKVIPPDVSSNIDDAIDDVIARGLTEREVMIENRDALRGNKKRRRSKSPNPVQPDQQTAPATLPQNCPVAAADCLKLPVPTIIVSSPRSTEQIAKKPRCSVVDLLTKKGAEAKHDVQLKSESIKSEQDKGPSQRKKPRSISPSKTSENTENKMDLDENEAPNINSDKIEDSASVITQGKFETS